jgi:hypothetical protein
MLKSFITLFILSAVFISCQNNDSKIEELEKKMQLQNDAMAKEREADLKKTSVEKDSEITKKSVQDVKAKPRMNCKAEYKYLLGNWKGTLRDKSLTVVIESIEGDIIKGYNIVGTNKRPLNGRIYQNDLEGDGECLGNGDSYKLVLSEPGDNKWDGVFKIYLRFCTYENEYGEMEEISYNGFGEWKANSGAKSGDVTLSKN